MRRHIAPLLAALAVLALLVGCGDDGDSTDGATTTSPPEDPLEGRTFEAVSIEGDTDRALAAGDPLRIGFADGEIVVETGCNRFTGPYEVEEVILSVPSLGGTERACPTPELTEQEAWISAVITGRPVITPQVPNRLVLTSDGTVLRLEAPVEGEVAELAGPTWTAEILIDGDAARSVPSGVTATLVFTEDGRYEVATGCNTGAGTYARSGPRAYTIDPPTLTDQLCDDRAMEVEAAVVAVLDGEVSASFETDRVTLTTAAGAGVAFTSG